MRAFSAALAIAVGLLPAISMAQSAPGVPAGVTVYVTASATTKDVVIATTATVKVSGTSPVAPEAVSTGAAAVEALRKRVGSAAVVSNDGLTVDAQHGNSVLQQIGLRIEPSQFAAVKAAVAAEHGTLAADAHLAARDQEALEEQALTNATRLARKRAEAVAEADGRHIGMLLNVTPSPVSLAKDAITSALTGGIFAKISAALAGAQGATATAGGLYTFALAP